FTKLIIYYLQSKHKFHPRPNSLLHSPNKEPVIGYLKFSAKGTKREVFWMPIPNKPITANIQGKPYYKEYLEKVTKHQRYLVGEKGSDPDSPAPKPAKAIKKSKPSAPKADLRPPVIPSSARKSKPGLVTKRRKPTSSLRSIDVSVDKVIPKKEPRFDDEEADVQRALEESLKSVYDAPRGPLPPRVRWNLMRMCQGLIREFKRKARLDQTLEPACSTRTLSSLPYLAKDLSFGDLFFKDNPFKADNKKTTTETKAESMVSVTIQQDTFAIPPMTTMIIDLTSRPDSPNVHRPLQAMVTETTTTTTIHPPPPQPQQSSTYSMLMKHIDLEYLRYGSKGSRPALSISKMKAAYYLDVGLEQMVPDQMWIEEECKYDIAVHLNHLPHKDKKILTTVVNLWTKHLDAMGFEYKHNYTVIDSSRAVTFRDKYEVQMIMRFNEIHKFSDGTLHQTDEALDYQVKELKCMKVFMNFIESIE
nr:hypothetical protein [Tanacetum cinerariifolium]